MRKKLPILLLALIILMQVFVPAVYAASKNEVISSTPSFCSQDTTLEGTGSTSKGFNTFNDAKKFLGSPGEGKQWHHIVEQSQINKSGFSSTQIQNTNNLITVDSATHAKISGYYSSKQAFTGGKTVRDWLAGQSYEKQFEFGMQKLRDFGVIK